MSGYPYGPTQVIWAPYGPSQLFFAALKKIDWKLVPPKRVKP